MDILRIILLVGAVALMVYALFKLNYKDLSWKVNKEYYLSMMSATCVMLAMLLSLFEW